MTATVLRKEIHEFIDTIPDQNLEEIQSYITCLLEETYTDSPIERADPDEIALIKAGLEEFRKNPGSFRPYSEIRKEHPQL